MNAWDFSILWQAGQALLSGQSPYSTPFFYYPLPFAYGMAIMALLPQKVSFGLWIAMNLFLLMAAFRKTFWHWLLYVPVLHMLSSGNVDLLFWAMERQMGRHWRGAILGALITLKPQVALLLLPWHILDWLRHDRLVLMRWLVITISLWGAPLVWDPSWVADWLQASPDLTLHTASNSPGLFSLLKIWPGIVIPISVVAVTFFTWGQAQGKETARACALLSSPIGLFYQTMALLGCAPAGMLVPVSLLAAMLSLLSGTFIPFALLPFVVIAWHRYRVFKPENASLTSNHSHPTAHCN